MKKLYLFKLMSLLLLALTFKNSFAQVIPLTAEIDYSFYNRMNYVFSPLEKDRVPYGLLRDFAMEFSPPRLSVPLESLECFLKTEDCVRVVMTAIFI